MATTNVTLTSGSFSYKDESITVAGNLDIHGKVIMNIGGIVTENSLRIGGFNASREDEESGQMRYNINYTDPSVATTLVSAVYAAVEAVASEIGQD